MSGSRKCPTCGVRYIGRDDVACWFCRNGYDPRGPGVVSGCCRRKGGNVTDCDGSSVCTAERHIHGCFSDRGDCDDPSEHVSVSPVDAAARAEWLAGQANFVEGGMPLGDWVAVVLREDAAVLRALASLLAVREAELRKAFTLLERAEFSAHDAEWARELMTSIRAAVPDGPVSE